MRPSCRRANADGWAEPAVGNATPADSAAVRTARKCSWSREALAMDVSSNGQQPSNLEIVLYIELQS